MHTAKRLTQRARQGSEHVNIRATFQARRLLQTSQSSTFVIVLSKTAHKHESTFIQL